MLQKPRSFFHPVGRWDDLGWDESNWGAFENLLESFFITGPYPQQHGHLWRIQWFFFLRSNAHQWELQTQAFSCSPDLSTTVPVTAVSLHPQHKFELTQPYAESGEWNPWGNLQRLQMLQEMTDQRNADHRTDCLGLVNVKTTTDLLPLTWW